MELLHKVAFVLLVVGGLNWGFEAFDYNLVEKLLGTWPAVVMVVYILVALSALYLALTHKTHCKACVSGSKM